MSRFFKKSNNIDDLTDKDINEFLYKEKLIGKTEKGRVRDFYNLLSNTIGRNSDKYEDRIDYDQFNCKNSEDREKVDQLKEMEKRFISSVNPEVVKGDRLLKAAAALSYKFEKEMYGGASEEQPENNNDYLTNLFMYSEQEDLPNGAEFADMLDKDLSFMKYIAMLSKKTAFSKTSGKIIKDNSGKITKYSPIENFNEIFGMDLVESVMPGFTRKLADKDIYVKTRFRKEDKAQNLIIMVDDSRSMNDKEKKAMLKAAILLKIKDKPEVNNIYIGTFISEVFGFRKVQKGDTFENFDFIKLNKGCTDVNNCVKDTIKQIKERKLKSFTGIPYDLTDDHFEILIINDGEDHVDPTFHPQIKTHALCLKRNNKSLKNICHRSSGTYHYLTS